MARCKQTARKVPIETVTVDISETTPVNFSPSSVPLSGKVTLRRLDPSDPAFSRYTWGAGSSLTTRGRNRPEIILRVKGEEVARKETKTKELGIVCFTRPVESGLEIWLEVLKNKQIKRTILPMASWEHDDLLPKGKGGVLDISDDIGSNDKYSEALSSLRFKLLSEKKSHSSMWEFLEQCHTYSVDLSQLGKVAQALIFKKHSDKKFDFADYMQRKGLKITLPSTDKDPLESGGAGTSTSGEGSKKLKGKADVPAKKLKVVGGVPPKKPATGTVRIGPTPDASKPATGTEQAPKLKIGPTPVVEYINESGDEDDTSTKTKKRKAVAVLQKKSGFQPERHVVETDQVAADVKMQLDPKTKDQFKPEFEELRQWFPLGDKLVYASISQLTDLDATAVTSLSGSRLLLMPRTSRM
ncbi:hypothetical protein R1sor_005028 [Riccia sorocarpa]|uniref:Uncharacterized protein n=1 Tax=Riccia sorocarpa TaxID=122646 RepID=A0ABD3HLV6_9MARC